MSQENIRIIKKRASIIRKAINVILFLGVILSFAALIVSAFLLFASPDKFNAVKGNLDWSINYSLTNGSHFFINIPFTLIQPLNSNMFSAKYAVITSFVIIFLRTALILYGINQVANILKSTANDITPFVLENVQRLKKLAYSIITYSVATDTLSNLLYSVFVTKISSINLSNIHLSGVLIGGLIFVIADIFKYGVFLQQEFDTTL